jgi:hypothetical protein
VRPSGTYKLVVIEPGANVWARSKSKTRTARSSAAARGHAFSAGGLAFTLADGATDFVSGDGFDIKVTGGAFKWKEYDPAGPTGEQVAAGILFDAVDATAADTKASRSCATRSSARRADLEGGAPPRSTRPTRTWR